jgi:hypothetical protein
VKRIPDQRDRSPVGWVCAAVTILTVAVPAWLIAQDAANTTTAPRGFGAFTPRSFLEATQPFSPNGPEQARKSWTSIQPDADGVPTVLRCTGQPTGYLRTRQVYGDFRISVQWRYPNNVNGNSGVLVHTTGPDKIWPRSIQVQLHAPKAGSILIHGGATTDNIVNVSNRIKDPRKWNSCVITCRAGELDIQINGKRIGRVTGCTPRSGQVALQSEGSEVHFRNIQFERSPKPAAQRATPQQ